MVLDVTAWRTVLRVRKVLSPGVFVLEGSDGVVWKDHLRNCAPCHLPNVNGSVDPSLAPFSVSLRCMLCGSTRDEAWMLMCNNCSRGWHMLSLNPSVEVVLVGHWVCP